MVFGDLRARARTGSAARTGRGTGDRGERDGTKPGRRAGPSGARHAGLLALAEVRGSRAYGRVEVNGMTIAHSEALESALALLNADQLDAFVDSLDVSTCAIGYDTDGSTCFEIFQNGYELAEKAKGRPVHYGDVSGTDGFTAYFIIGTEEEALAAVAKVLEENPSEPA
jgi:hypothetical protein